MCERCSRFFKKTLARWQSIVLVHLIISLNKVFWFEKTLHFLLEFQFAISHKQVNIRSSIGSISRLRSSRNHQDIAMDSYQSYFRKLNVFFSGKQQRSSRTDQKKFIIFFSTIFAWWYVFQSSYITFDIFENSTFFGIVEKTWKITTYFYILKT